MITLSPTGIPSNGYVEFRQPSRDIHEVHGHHDVWCLGDGINLSVKVVRTLEHILIDIESEEPQAPHLAHVSLRAGQGERDAVDLPIPLVSTQTSRRERRQEARHHDADEAPRPSKTQAHRQSTLILSSEPPRMRTTRRSLRESVSFRSSTV